MASFLRRALAALLIVTAHTAGAQTDQVQVRWLGVAGFSIVGGATTLLVDPYFSRYSAWKLFIDADPYCPDAGELRSWLTSARVPELAAAKHVLIGHSHFDHLGDAEEVIGEITLDRRRDVDVGRILLAAQRCDLMEHDQHRADRELHIAVMAAPRLAHPAGDVDGDGDVAALAHMIERHRIGDAAIDIELAVDEGGGDEARYGDRGGDRPAHGPRGNDMLAPLGEIGGDDLERDLGVLDMFRHAFGEDEAGELLAIDQERGEAAPLQEIAEPRAFHAEQVFGRLHPVGEDVAGMIVAGAAKDADSVRRYLTSYEEAGCDELIFCPSSADPEQVDLLAEAAGL